MNMKPSQLMEHVYSKVGPHHYHRNDYDFPPEQRESIVTRLRETKPDRIENSKVSGIDTEDGFRFRLSDGSWLLIRVSGTEPLLRIYAESQSMERVERLLEVGKEFAGI
jgi:phosphomannomutase